MMKAIEVIRYVACGIWILNFAFDTYRLLKIKKQDPASTEKQDLIVIKMTLDLILFALFLKKVSIYFWI